MNVSGYADEEEEWEAIKWSIYQKVRRRLAEDEEFVRLIEQGNKERVNLRAGKGSERGQSRLL